MIKGGWSYPWFLRVVTFDWLAGILVVEFLGKNSSFDLCADNFSSFLPFLIY